MLASHFVQLRSGKAVSAFHALLPDIRRNMHRMGFLRDQQLVDLALAAREAFAREASHVGKPHALSASHETVKIALALAGEALRRTRHIELFDVQFMAGLALADDKIAEMATGEGKTFAVFPAAVIRVLQGYRCHIATPNAYLAQRDFDLLTPAYEALGLTAGLLGDHNAAPESKMRTYRCDIVYGTGFDFGFDYLRDQAAARGESSQPLGSELLERLRGRTAQAGGWEPGTRFMQVGRQVAIIDEVDHVLLDDAGSPLILCNAPQGEAEDAQVIRLARSLIRQLQAPEHFQLANDSQAKLTNLGIEFIHTPDLELPVRQLRRPWTEYVEQALRAEFVFRRDVHYVVDEGQIQIIDGNTGRIYSDRSWNEGLHQAIEAKEGLQVTPERSAVAQITRQRYFRMYEHLAGMTGTAVGCEQEFRAVYGLAVRRIPPRLPCLRTILPSRVFTDAERKWNSIAEDVQTVHRTGRPILIGTRTILDSEKLAERLRSQGVDFQLLNGKQDAEEASVIARAGVRGAITIATNLAGRGTDIQLSPDVLHLGGLHVVVSEPNELERMDRQLVGRCARQGDPGSAQLYASAEDALIELYGSWLVAPILRGAKQGELPLDITQRLRAIQRFNERRHAVARLQLMKRDLARESLLSGIPHES